jgi:hypothetical protein
VVKHMGFGGVNGASLGAISAAAKYGLLDYTDNQYRVTERMLAILHPNTPTEKIEAIAAAARSPELFVEIFDSFPGAPPSDENLRSYLIRRGFSQSALGAVIQSFRETMELAPMAISGHSAGPHEVAPEAPMNAGHPGPEPVRRGLVSAAPPATPSAVPGGRGPMVTPLPTSGTPRATYPLREGVAALELPEDLSEESLEDVRDWIETLLRAADRAAKRAKQAAAQKLAELMGDDPN